MSDLVPALQWPFSLLQHKAFMFIRPLDIRLADLQSFNDLPAVCFLHKAIDACINQSKYTNLNV